MKPTSYAALETALQAIGIPCAENEWNTRPTGDYITYALEFEADADYGDDRKVARAWEGSVDFWGSEKWSATADRIEEALEECCSGLWRCNIRGAWERETGLFRWEWVFQTEV